MTPDQNSSASRSMITPKSLVSNKHGGSKLRQDLGARAHEANLQEQELILKREAEKYAKGLKIIEDKLIIKDKTVGKLEARVKQMEEEIERRKFVEAKVQTYVRSLIDQNEKCKTYIRAQTNEQGDQSAKAASFLHALETNQFDEHDGQSTENDEEEEGDDLDGQEVEEID